VADFSDLNPAFASKLAQLRAALTAQGIQNSLVSGYRSPEYQGQMYANHQAKVAGQPLPYPNVEAPNVVAPPWRSFHNYGIATDFQLGNDADYPRLQSMAPQYGLTGIGMSDKGHIQLGGDLASDIAQYHLANWRPESMPAPATGAIAYTGATAAPSRVATTAPGTSLNSSPMDLVATLESGNKNIPQAIKDKNSAAGTPAGGFFQIIDPTWQTYAKAAGVDLNQYPTAMSAPRNIQAQVASAIPVNQWGANTVNALKSKYPGLDTSQTLGQWQSQAINPSGAPTAAPGAPAAVAATPATGTTLPGFQPGSPANTMAQNALKKLGGGGTGDASPEPMRLQQAQPAQAMGGPMMMGPGGQNFQGRTAAAQDLAQRGFSMQPQLASYYGALGATRPAVAPMTPGQATGIPGLPGTTLNSPSQLQMAMMSGQISPYDYYANAGTGGGGFGST
jgi:hypothetical protein